MCVLQVPQPALIHGGWLQNGSIPFCSCNQAKMIGGSEIGFTKNLYA